MLIFYSFSAGIDIRRQNLTSREVKLKSIPALRGLNPCDGELSVTIFFINLKPYCTSSPTGPDTPYISTLTIDVSCECPSQHETLTQRRLNV